MRLLIGSILCCALLACSSDEELAERYLSSAKEYFANGQFELALVESRNVVRADPRRSEGYLLLVDVHEELEQWPAMFRALTRLRELSPEDVSVKLRLARLLLLAGEVEPAAELAEAMISDRPGRLDELILLALVRMAQGDVVEAKSLALAAREIDPDNLDALNVEITLLLEEESYAEAHAALSRASIESQNQVPLLLQRLKVFSAQQDSAEVERILVELILLDSDNLQYRLVLAALKLRTGNRVEADAVLERAVDDLSESVEAKLAYASFLSEESPPRAIQTLRSYVDQSPKNPDLRFALATMLRERGEIAGAAAIYREVVETHLDSSSMMTANNELARIALGKSEFFEARSHIENVLAQDNGNPEALVLRAFAYLSENQLEEALTDVRTVLRGDPVNDQALAVLGGIYESQGAESLAEDSFRAALDANPMNESVADNLAKLLVRRGKLDEAAGVLRPLVTNRQVSALVHRYLIQLELALENWDYAAAVTESYPDTRLRGTLGEIVGALIYQGKGEYELAQTAFLSLLEDSDVRGAALVGLMSAYHDAGESDEALKVVSDVVRENPKDRTALMLLAQELRLRGEIEQTRALWKRSLAEQPQWALGAQIYGDFLVEQQEYLIAESAYLMSYEIAPKAEVRMRLAMVSEALGNHERARSLYRKLLKDTPTFDLVRNNLAASLSKSADTLEEAYKVGAPLANSEEAYYLDTIGWILALRGDYQSAMPLLLRSVDSDSDVAEFRYHLGWVYYRMKKFDDAKEMLTASLELAGGELNLTSASWLDDAQRLLDQI